MAKFIAVCVPWKSGDALAVRLLACLAIVVLFGFCDCGNSNSRDSPPTEMPTVLTVVTEVAGIAIPASNLTMLSMQQALDLIEALCLAPVNKATVSRLAELYVAFVKLPSRLVAENPQVVTQIRVKLSALVTNILNERPESAALIGQDLSLIIKTGEPMRANRSDVYTTDKFIVREACLVSVLTNFAYVIYKANTSPFRPLPNVTGTIVDYQVIDLLRIRTPNGFLEQAATCSWFSRLELVMLKFALPKGRVVKRGCGSWSDALSDWTPDECIVLTTVQSSWATCMCETKATHQTTQYIVYSYAEFDESLIGYREVNSSKIADPKNASELQDYTRWIAANVQRSESRLGFEEMLTRGLYGVFQFDRSLYMAAGSDSLLRDIGAGLANVVPFRDSGLLGQGSGFMTSLALRLDLFKGDPIIGFAFYARRSMWMEYYRSRDGDARHKIFRPDIEYAFLFAPSVLRQNSRYAFLLYPRDAYFKPPPSTVGNSVVIASRVIDVVVTPKTMRDEQEESIHLYFRSSVNTTMAARSCAYWSETADGWSADGCAMNPRVHKHVCTCTMSKVATAGRTQFVVYEFTRVDHSVVGEIDTVVEDGLDLTRMESWAFALGQLDKLDSWTRQPDFLEDRDFAPLMELVASVVQVTDGNSLRHDSQTVALLTKAIRRAMTSGVAMTRCSPYSPFGFNALLLSPSMRDFDIVAFQLGTHFVRYLREDPHDLATTVTLGTLFFLEMSESAIAANVRYAFFVYPPNVYPRDLPDVANVVAFRVVDIVLVPGKLAATGDDQMAKIYVGRGETASTVGCAVWDDAEDAWTAKGCARVRVDAVQFCNCNLSARFDVARTGGTYLVYRHVDAHFDDDVYASLGKSDNATSLLVKAAALLANGTVRKTKFESMIKYLDILANVLATDLQVLSASQRENANGTAVNASSILEDILHDFGAVTSDYFPDLALPVMHSYGISTKSRIKKSDVCTDLYSNSFLDDDWTLDGEVASALTLVAFGFYPAGMTNGPVGFYLDRNISDLVKFSPSSDDFFASPGRSLGCLVMGGRDRFASAQLVFVVYPINKSTYPTANVTASPIFNLRQVDIYVNGIESAKDFKGVSIDPKLKKDVDITFQPNADQKPYVRLGCAAWGQADWVSSQATCEMRAESDTSVCRCALDERKIVRVILFEYTELKNFSPRTQFDAAGHLFIVGAFLSILGIAFIVCTALFFPEWRQSLGNKIFLHLTAATMLYLCTTLYRETHTIFLIPDRVDTRVIAFNVIVHYTRLAHYCWMLVISVKYWQGGAWSNLEPTDAALLLRKIAVFAWGLPVVPLVVLLMWDQKVHFLAPRRLTHYVLFLVPGGFTVVFNVLLLLAITVRMCRVWHVWKKANRISGVSDRNVVCLQVKAVVQMFFLFGIPTTFEVVNGIGKRDAVLDALFEIVDPLQGFMMFVFFVCLDPGTRGLWFSCNSAELLRLDMKPTPAENLNSVFDETSCTDEPTMQTDAVFYCCW